MKINPGIKIIGETINDSIPSTRGMFDDGDIAGIQRTAAKLAAGGACYLDINIGARDPGFMRNIVEAVQDSVDLPLSIDSPDYETQKAGLTAYNSGRAAGKSPIVNSISELRPELFQLSKIQTFIPILMASERMEDGKRFPNKTGEDIYNTASRLVNLYRRDNKNNDNNAIIIDPGLAPVGTDYENIIQASLDGMKLIHEDPDMKGVHLSVGLSNFGIMLPPKTRSGIPVRQSLENAFLTLAKPLGLDYIIGSPVREYMLLEEGHPALICLREAMEAGGYGSIERIQKFLTS